MFNFEFFFLSSGNVYYTVYLFIFLNQVLCLKKNLILLIILKQEETSSCSN